MIALALYTHCAPIFCDIYFMKGYFIYLFIYLSIYLFFAPTFVRLFGVFLFPVKDPLTVLHLQIDKNNFGIINYTIQAILEPLRCLPSNNLF